MGHTGRRMGMLSRAAIGSLGQGKKMPRGISQERQQQTAIGSGGVTGEASALS